MYLIVTTASSREEAEKIANGLVAGRLAACVQIVPEVNSIYFWEGEVRRDSEFLLSIKTLDEKYDAVEAYIKANHSYDVPEIAAVKAERVSAEYLKWLEALGN
jgi:periplasmic divalent cation tolerance protein